MDQTQLFNTITEIRVELGKLATRLEKLDDFSRNLDELRRQVQDISRRVEEVETLAMKTIENAKSAHLRLNGINKVFFWFLTAVGGSAIVTIVGFVMKGGFDHP